MTPTNQPEIAETYEERRNRKTLEESYWRRDAYFKDALKHVWIGASALILGALIYNQITDAELNHKTIFTHVVIVVIYTILGKNGTMLLFLLGSISYFISAAIQVLLGIKLSFSLSQKKIK